MAVKTIELNAALRAGTGKGAARAARREGQVPGVIYGGNAEPTSINVAYNVLLKNLKNGGFKTSLINLNIEGQEPVQVVCRAVQRHVVKDLPTHVDFLRLTAETRIALDIPVRFTNEEAAPGIQKGGSVAAEVATIVLEVAAGAVPEAIEIDLTGKKINEVINLSDIVLPEGVVAVAAKDFAVATIAAPAGYIAGSDEE